MNHRLPELKSLKWQTPEPSPRIPVPGEGSSRIYIFNQTPGKSGLEARRQVQFSLYQVGCLSFVSKGLCPCLLQEGVMVTQPPPCMHSFIFFLSFCVYDLRTSYVLDTGKSQRGLRMASKAAFGASSRSTTVYIITEGFPAFPLLLLDSLC